MHETQNYVVLYNLTYRNNSPVHHYS